MWRLLRRSLSVALITTLVGGMLYYHSDLEIDWGLDTLFQLRGTRPPPTDVVVVAMDEKSETTLGVSYGDYTEWRRFHARVIREMKRQRAALVIFDLNFIQPKPEIDPDFADAMTDAGNVLITECVSKLDLESREFSGREECSRSNSQRPSETNIKSAESQRHKMYHHLPTPALAQAAQDHAPFFLPWEAKSPVIHEAWTFISQFDSMPTLPITAWLHYLKHSAQAMPAPSNSKARLSGWLAKQRQYCQNERTPDFPADLPDITRLQLTKLVCHEDDTAYLDFYGPPKTLRMVSYSDVYNGLVPDLKGKAVFIGKANLQYIGGKTTDVFRTPFTSDQTGQMFGVEIMATQFANLLEQRSIEAPCPPLLALWLFGMTVGLLLAWFPGLGGIGLTLLVSAIYVGFARWGFSHFGWWLPVAIPLLIQLSIAWLMSLLWTRRDLLKEKQRIVEFIQQSFPNRLRQVARGKWGTNDIPLELTSNREVSGICLATDIEGYTNVANHLASHDLWELLSAYYHVVGEPVSTNNGMIANVTGDAMMAYWIDMPFEQQCQSACNAALEIVETVGSFNNARQHPLPTRIGLYSGEFMLGSGDAGAFKFYNPFGNTLNTASRIEGLNKYLKTRILVTEAIARNTSNLIVRPVGAFLLKGLDDPVELVEILAKENGLCETSPAQLSLFAQGLAAFRQGRWHDSARLFQQLVSAHDDGPAQFYWATATHYESNPPSDWQGYVRLENK